MTGPLLWSHRVSAVPAGGLVETRAASAAERSAAAEALGIIACDELKADYVIRAIGAGRYGMKGSVAASLTQECVVTLAPVRQTVAEAFSVEFWPSLPDVSDAEVEVLSVPDIEPIEHGLIEAGRVIFEILAASVDPYPRSEGARFEWEDAADAAGEAEAGPFSALKRLKGDT
jgi:hypothetical protein